MLEAKGHAGGRIEYQNHSKTHGRTRGSNGVPVFRIEHAWPFAVSVQVTQLRCKGDQRMRDLGVIPEDEVKTRMYFVMRKG